MSPSPNRSSQFEKSSTSGSDKMSETSVSPPDDLQVTPKNSNLTSEDSTQAETDPSSAQAEESEIQTSVVDESSSTEEQDDDVTRMWQHPIPPPSEPRQYRAIGLVRGRYIASADQFTQGMLLTTDEKIIDAVLLGRVMSLVKKHINPEQEHLWVVYPRTRQQEGTLHVQIMGVWEPETLKTIADESNSEPSEGETSASGGDQADTSTAESGIDDDLRKIEHGYFSIRGEVVYQSQEPQKYVIIKIRQAPRKDEDKPKFFKLKLNGIAGPKAVGHFWDLHVQLQEDELVIQESHDMGLLFSKGRKKPFSPQGRGRGKPGGYSPRSSSRPSFNKPPSSETPAPRREPLPKPTKRKPTSESAQE